MSITNKTYWEVCIEINPICADVLCDIVQTDNDGGNAERVFIGYFNIIGGANNAQAGGDN